MTKRKVAAKTPVRGEDHARASDESGVDIDPLIDEVCELAERRDAMRELVAAGGKAAKPEFTPERRAEVLRRAGGLCVICGGKIEDAWAALPTPTTAEGAPADPGAYLPAHHVCANYRTDYLAEEFQLMLRFGVWMRSQIERESDLGLEMAERFMKAEREKQKRRERKAAKSRAAASDAPTDDDE